MSEKAGMRAWVKVVLFGSLALNLLVAGLAVGAFLHGPPNHGGRDRDPALPFTRAFDEDQRRDLRRALRNDFETHRGTGPGIVEDYSRALDVLRAEPFDPEALRDLLEAQGARADERRKRGQAILAQALTDLTPEARRAYADRLEQELNQIIERRAHWMDKRPRD